MRHCYQQIYGETKGENTKRAMNKNRIPHPALLINEVLFVLFPYLECMKGIKSVNKKQSMRPLYFVPIASPQQRADKIKSLTSKPLSSHFNNSRSDAAERNITPKST